MLVLLKIMFFSMAEVCVQLTPPSTS